MPLSRAFPVPPAHVLATSHRAHAPIPAMPPDRAFPVPPAHVLATSHRAHALLERWSPIWMSVARAHPREAA
ncbi:MAG: hypothetical protein Q4P06_07385 [Actinomycetaceae bacterium]|nr:hypothetical protein [Actinomycetaceae bacterium]